MVDFKKRLSPEEIEANKEAARQMMRHLLNPQPPQSQNRMPKLLDFIANMGSPKGGTALPQDEGVQVEAPSLPQIPSPESVLPK